MALTGVAMLPAAFLVTAVLSWLAVFGARRLAWRWNVLDIPNDRSSHSRVVPLCGGAAIVAVNVCAWISIGFIQRQMTWQHALVFIVGALAVASVSLLDDLRHVPCPIRLGVHLGVAVLFVTGYVYWNHIALPVAGTLTLGAAGAVVTVIWIVGLINAYNFMDGIDGMLGGQAVAAGVGWVALGILLQSWLILALGALLSASTLGFLIHNWHPARIFMGDVGSTFLGYSFAALPVIAARSEPRMALAGVILVWPAVFDTTFTVVRRLRSRESILIGHRTFLFHRLVDSGWSHSAAATLYMVLPIVGAVLACTWASGNRVTHTGIAVVLALACGLLWMFVRRQERSAELRIADRERLAKQALLEGALQAYEDGEHLSADM